MNRIDRLQAILTTLQSKRVVKAEELATRFEVSIRTIYRDIRALELGGVPIGAEAGVGYFLMEGYHIPPVMFTHEEARALLLAGKIVEQFTDQTTAKIFNDALTKVKAVLDTDKKDDLESLEKDIMIDPFPNKSPAMGTVELQINQIKQALADSKVVSIEYHSKGKGEHTKRDLEPIGLSFYMGGWHLMAYCRLREDYRDFRLDRISKLQLLGKTYTRFKHPSLKEYIDKLINETELIEVVLEIDKETHKYLEDHKYQMGLVEEQFHKDVVEMKFTVFGPETFARWILMLGKNVKIVRPDKIRDRVQALVKELSELYSQ